jgi:hypothetical protein
MHFLPPRLAQLRPCGPKRIITKAACEGSFSILRLLLPIHGFPPFEIRAIVLADGRRFAAAQKFGRNSGKADTVVRHGSKLTVPPLLA